MWVDFGLSKVLGHNMIYYTCESAMNLLISNTSCFFKVSFLLNPFPQKPHLWGVSPVCVITCFLGSNQFSDDEIRNVKVIDKDQGMEVLIQWTKWETMLDYLRWPNKKLYSDWWIGSNAGFPLVKMFPSRMTIFGSSWLVVTQLTVHKAGRRRRSTCATFQADFDFDLQQRRNVQTGINHFLRNLSDFKTWHCKDLDFSKWFLNLKFETKPELVGPVVFIWALGAMEPERRSVFIPDFWKKCFFQKIDRFGKSFSNH